MSSSHKITATQTGTLFYTKIGESTGRYRVRFRSFQQAQLENREVQDELEQLHTNYKYFKYVCINVGMGRVRAIREACSLCWIASPFQNSIKIWRIGWRMESIWRIDWNLWKAQDCRYSIGSSRWKNDKNDFHASLISNCHDNEWML